MPTLHIPAAMRPLAGGARSVDVPAETLAEAIDRLEERHPGLKARLVEGGRLRPGLQVFVNDEMPTSGLRTRLAPDAQVYFAPAIAGGVAPPTSSSYRAGACRRRR